MTYAPRLGKSGIEYLDMVWNCYSGCRHWQNPAVCPVGENCWVKATTERFSACYPNGFEPTFYPGAFLSPLSIRKPARIGVCFMGDLFGEWNDPEQKYKEEEIRQYIKGDWMFRTIRTTDETFAHKELFTLREIIYRVIESRPQHAFIFLTKNPAGLLPWSPFPDNCHVGVSVCNRDMLGPALQGLAKIQAGLRWLSFEPLLDRITVSPRVLKDAGIGWVVIGGITGTRANMEEAAAHWSGLRAVRLADGGGPKWGALPPLYWVCDLVLNAGAAGIPVFLKDNIYKVDMECPGTEHDLYWEDMANLRREYPEARVQTPKEYAAELYLGHTVVGGS